MTRKLIIALTALALLGALIAGPAQARRLSTLVAPTSVCPNQTETGDSAAVQEEARLEERDHGPAVVHGVLDFFRHQRVDSHGIAPIFDTARAAACSPSSTPPTR